MNNELWKPVVGYEGVYSVSSFGRIRRDSLARGTSKGHILKHNFDNRGYPVIQLTRKSKKRSFKCHALVAAAFLGPRPEGLQVNHIDGNYKNNREENLELLCPNCHSLTPNYRSLNRGKGRKR